MGGLRGRELQADMNLRKSRMSRLADSGLLDIFLAARKAGLARGLSVIEANDSAHCAVETRLNDRPVISKPELLDPQVLP